MTTTKKSFSRLLLAMSSIALVTMLSSGSVFADSNNRVLAKANQVDKNYTKNKTKDRRYRRDGNTDRRSDRRSNRNSNRRSDSHSRNNSRYDRHRDRSVYRQHNSGKSKNKYKRKQQRSHRSNYNYGVTYYTGSNCRYVYNRYDERVKRCYPNRYTSYHDNGRHYGSRYHDSYGNYYNSYRRGRYTRKNHRGHSRHGHYYDNNVGQWIALAVLFDILLDD